jgi:hypothetical protein
MIWDALQFLTGPIGRWIMAAALVAALIWGIYDKGQREALDTVKDANAAAASKADAAEIGVLKCQQGKWNKETRKCEQ